MGLGVAKERRKNDGEESLTVVTDETHDMVIVPVVESSLSNLGGEGGEGGRVVRVVSDMHYNIYI